MFIQVSEETATNVIADLEDRLKDANNSCDRQQLDNYAVRQKLYDTQDKLVAATTQLQHRQPLPHVRQDSDDQGAARNLPIPHG